MLKAAQFFYYYDTVAASGADYETAYLPRGEPA